MADVPEFEVIFACGRLRALGALPFGEYGELQHKAVQQVLNELQGLRAEPADVVCSSCDAPLSCGACGAEQSLPLCAGVPSSDLQFIAWRVNEMDDVAMRNLLESKDVGTGRGRLKSMLLQAFGKRL